MIRIEIDQSILQLEHKLSEKAKELGAGLVTALNIAAQEGQHTATLFTRVDTGTLQDSLTVGKATKEKLESSFYVDPMAINPKDGKRAIEYAGYQNYGFSRGGSFIGGTNFMEMGKMQGEQVLKGKCKAEVQYFCEL